MASRESSRRFHFLKEIASGGFGSVYLAKVMHADGFSRLAAIKLLHQRWSENVEIAQRMRDEARLLGWLRHRNIVDVIDLTTIGGRVAVIMEYLEAIDFKDAINQVADAGERMPPRAALEATAFVASALDAAYNRPPYQGEKPLRVIHRDIKPSNIMVDEAGTVKVLDFGVARADFDSRESHTQELQFGSVDYMPPERLFFEPETPFSDVYSLGATLYELLALEKLGKAKGRPEKHAQFLADRLAYLRTRCDLDGLSGDATIELVAQMCAYNHEQRPSAADAVPRLRALARGFDGEGLTEWAERLIPPLVKANREAPREPNPLTDSVLSEDSVSFKADDTFVQSQEVEGGVVVRPEDSVPSQIPKTDERWDLLRQAALSEMQAQADPNAAFSDGPTVLGRYDEDVDVVDEAGFDVGPPPTLAAQPSAPEAPPRPAPRAPEPPRSGVRPAAVGSALRNSPTMIPDEDEHAPTQAFRAGDHLASLEDDPAADPAAFGQESTVVGGGQVTLSPEDGVSGIGPPDDTAHGVPAGSRGVPATASDPPKSPALPYRAAEASRSAEGSRSAEAPRSAARPPPVASVLDEEPDAAPAKRSWLVPALVAVLLLGVVGAGGLVVVGGALLSGAGGGDVPEVPLATPSGAATAAVPVATGPLMFVSAAPETAKITVSCDGTESSGPERVGFSLEKADKCSVKVMLKDRTRLFADVSGVEAGTWRCFEGGSKECVR